MDAIKVLKQDHRKVEQLFAELEALGERALKSRGKLMAKICQELKTHAELEETIFYPAFRQEAEDEDTVLEAFEEHHVVKFLIAELETLDPGHERFMAKATVLKELVQHHVEEEEGEMFPEALEALGKDEIQALGDRIEAARPAIQAKANAPRVSVTLMPEAKRAKR
jgi:hemerythrin-like domain-containing protein